MKRIGLILAIVLLVGCFFGFRHWRANAQAASKAAAEQGTVKSQVQRRDIEQIVRARGEIKAPLTTEVKSEVNGRVTSVNVTAGDMVKEGDTLVELDKSELESQLNEVQHQIEASRLNAEKKKLDLGREKQLIESKLVTQKEYDEVRIDEELALNQLAIDSARAETLRRQLAKTTILAPRTGKVLKIDVLPGMVIIGAGSVSNGTSLMTVADLSKLEVNADMDEIDVAQLEVGMPVHLSLESNQDLKLEGKIKFVSPQAVSKETDKSIKVFPIVISLDSTDRRLKVGLTANFQIPVSQAKQVLALPISLVSEDEKTSYVFVKEKGAITRRNIKVGINDAEYVEIKSGLSEGEEVFINPNKEKDAKKS